MDKETDLKQLITYGTLHIAVLGPSELGKSPAANGCVAEFLRAAEHDVRNLLCERVAVAPSLKGFRILFG